MATTNWEWGDVSKVDRTVYSFSLDGLTSTEFREQRWTLTRSRKVDAAFAGDTDEGASATSLSAYNGTRLTTINRPTFWNGTANVLVSFECDEDKTTMIENGVEWNEQSQTWVAFTTISVT